jgi:hypothetical protein
MRQMKRKKYLVTINIIHWSVNGCAKPGRAKANDRLALAA